MLPINDFLVKDSMLSISKGTLISLDAKPLQASEKLVLIFVDSNKNSLSLERSGPSSTPEVIIRPKELSSLAKGNAELYLVRIRKESQQQGRFTITINTEFYTATKQVSLVE